MSPRWLIGALFMFVMFTIIANVLDEQTQPLRAEDISVLEGSIQSGVTETKESSSGGVAVFWNTSRTVGQNLGRIFLFDYGFFYDTDGNPNEYMIFRFVFLLPLAILSLWLALLFRQIVFG